MLAIPRLLLAGTHSSVGKTSVAVGLLAALRRRGRRVAPFKAGPDYIDPGLHAQAAGRPSRNLDSWLLDEPALLGVLERGVQHAAADLAVIEGVMGLFDGIGSSQQGSTAALARSLSCPVILVLDVAAMSGTAAALVLGCQQLQPGVHLAGVVLNRVGSPGHLRSTAEAILAATGLPTLGSLPADAALAVPERHLGLVPAAEGGLPASVVDALAQQVAERFDLDAIERIARTAPPLPEPERPPLDEAPRQVRVGVARDRAFGFYYEDTFDLLAELGAAVVPFSPLDDADLPSDLDGLYLGGGFPELYARELADNHGMRRALQAMARRGKPIYAECGGLMALGRALVTFEGEEFAGFDLLPLVSRMRTQRLTIGYREVEALRDSPLLERGQRVRGHEFHWSEAEEPPTAVAAYRVLPDGGREGYCRGAVLGSYVHLNFAGNPGLLARFVRCMAAA